ncbi:hypothetical protein HHI36_008066 [Cryptolaemus montrouzieri]|uniref:Uncharacterized protein n=1 Tax=Cryptolaemus montrouzieri TaxID=559131 RepID=A0ABD2MRG5_9CUCU
MPNEPEQVSVETKKLKVKLKLLKAKKKMLFQRSQKSFDYIKDLNKPKVAEYFTVGLHSLEDSKIQLMSVVEDTNLVSLEINDEFIPSYQVLEEANDLRCHIIEASKSLDEAKT